VAENGSKQGVVECENCIHFREAPYEALRTGCYHPDLMQAKQKAAYLDEQQIPGDHTVLNRNGDCSYYEAPEPKPSIWKRLFSLEA